MELKKVALFDLDGVVLDTEGAIYGVLADDR